MCRSLSSLSPSSLVAASVSTNAETNQMKVQSRVCRCSQLRGVLLAVTEAPSVQLHTPRIAKNLGNCDTRSPGTLLCGPGATATASADAASPNTQPSKRERPGAPEGGTVCASMRVNRIKSHLLHSSPLDDLICALCPRRTTSTMMLACLLGSNATTKTDAAAKAVL